MPGRSEHVPEWLVERLAKRELSPEVAADVRARLEAAGDLHRLAAIDASDRAILAAHPPATVAAEVARRLRRDEGRARSRRLRLAVSGVAIAAAASIAVFLLPIRPLEHSGGETVTSKGLRPYLVVYRKTASESARLEPKSPVRPGDVLQLAYVAAGRRYGVVASVDARGTTTLHLPEAPGASPRLVPQGEIALPHAFELDDAPGFERFVLVTADVPFSTDVVVGSLRPNGRPLPHGVTATEVLVTKELQ